MALPSLKTLVCSSIGVDALPEIKGKRRALKPLSLAQTTLTSPLKSASVNLDQILNGFESDQLHEWLETVNSKAAQLVDWWHKGSNAILFSHFWLSEMADRDRDNLLKLESTVLHDRVALALDVALEEKRILVQHIDQVIEAAYPELPSAFYVDDGAGCLDIFHIIASPNSPAFKTFMAAAPTAPQNDKARAALLALRSYGLITTLAAIADFYNNLCKVQTAEGFARPGTSTASTGYAKRPLTSQAKSTPDKCESPLFPDPESPGCSLPSHLAPVPAIPSEPETGICSVEEEGEATFGKQSAEQAFEAARLGHADVVYYYLERSLVTLDAQDNLGRTLLFIACLHARMDVAQLILSNTTKQINTPAFSGNTPLHAAASAGHLTIVQLLLKHGADAAPKNPNMGDITPLMLAQMMDHEAVAEFLEVNTSDSQIEDVPRPTTASQRARESGADEVAQTLDRLKQLN
eukprot:TRINITY_DN6312_c0_g1_i4.p1 TRINITY_DN6312_c0_g1~~TRINITY_DN6312_c0_g1_i4.p1  ORF type:complete len:464 (+),score=73.73 TRINITY_DN6312_c0_g1_i4:58-1449(+)